MMPDTNSYMSKYTGSKIDELLTKIDNFDISTLTQKVDTNSSNITTNVNNISNNTTSISNNGKRIDEVQKSINSLDANIKDINNNSIYRITKALQISADSNELVQVQSRLAEKASETDLNRTTNRVNNLESQVNALENNTASSSNLQSLQNRVSSLESNVSNQSSSISNLQTTTSNSLNSLTSRVNDLEDESASYVKESKLNETLGNYVQLSAFEEYSNDVAISIQGVIDKNMELEALIGTNAENIGIINTTIEEQQNTIAQLEKDLADMTSLVNSLIVRIEKLEKNNTPSE